jgi:hypothetical protein
VPRPSFRFFIIPLGAVCTLASLPSYHAVPRAQPIAAVSAVHQQVTDCSNTNPAEVCVIR